MQVSSPKHQQQGFTLFEMMLAMTVTILVIMAGILYVRSVYRGHLVDEGEQLILQIVSSAQHYHTAANIKSADKTGYLNQVPFEQYYGISTTWVANTGNIPGQYVQLTGDQTSPLGILSPWSDVPAIDISAGSKTEHQFDCGNIENSGQCVNNDTYVAIAVHDLPNYACDALAVRLQQSLGGDRQVNNVPVTQTYCDDSDPDNSSLYLSTKPDYL